MCQPGTAAARAEVSHAGSPGRSACHSRQSSGSFLPGRSGSPPRSAKIAQHLLAAPAGDLAEGRVVGHREVEVVRRPGRPRPLSCSWLDHVDDQRDRLDRADVVVRGQHPQRLHVGAEQLGLALGERRPVLAVACRALEQRVVDVGDVLDVATSCPAERQARLSRSKAT